MAVVLYQRAEPRQKQWLPLLSQQIRLRNVTQIHLLNPTREREGLYFTLHVSPMSAPFFTSEKVIGNKVTVWKEIHFPFASTRLSATGCILRVWTGGGEPLFSWGIRFQGLHYLGLKDEWSANDFADNTVLISTPYGSFTSMDYVLVAPVGPQRFLQIRSPFENTRNSYTLKNLVGLHRLQRSVLEEFDVGEKLRIDLSLHGYKCELPDGGNRDGRKLMLSERLVQKVKLGQAKLRLKEEIEMVKLKVSCLREEKGRGEGRVGRLKKEVSRLEEMSSDLLNRIHSFRSERVNLKDTKAELTSKGQHLSSLRSKVFLRKKQLISELLQIYPLALIEGTKRYSINGVQLPNAEDYGSEGGGQISVALGYTAHLVAMLAFFLDIPSRYSIRHFGSRSRIIDHITIQIPDKEREFPLYFKGKRDVYCAYAVYLLNKNVGQLRWYCAMSTPDLRATLPNLVELIASRLVIPGWPPNLAEALEIAQEITEEADSNFLEDNELTRSLDQGLDKLRGENVGESYLKARRESFSENPGGNSTALGEIQHGRGQERFLSGWKKKTYVETDDFDPKWLLDSMNLDFDTSRRFSITTPSTLASSPPKPAKTGSNNSSTRTSEDNANNASSRRRRIGQVEPPALSNFPSSSYLRDDTPVNIRVNLADNINIVDSMKKSANTENRLMENVERPLASTKEKDINLKDMVQLENQIKEMERRKSRVASPYPQQKNNQTDNLQSVQSSEIILQEDNNSVDSDPKDDPNQSQVTQDISGSGFGLGKTSDPCDSTYHIPPPIEGLQEAEDIDSNPSFENSISIEPTNVASASTAVVAEDNLEAQLKSPSADFKESVLDLVTTDCDNNTENFDEGETTDSALWIRTEALLGAQSFNLVRRKMSEST